MKFARSTFFLGSLIGGLGAGALPLLINVFQSPVQGETRLLPFQGRLTDATGGVLSDGAKVVEFKLYDAPTGGNVKWAGEVHKLSVNGGLVNTMLGSKASLGSVDFSTPTFLQITVDANGDDSITAADPPLLPRQSVVSSLYASVAGRIQYQIPPVGGNSPTVASAGWEAVFDNGRPDTGKITGSKLVTGSVGIAQMDPNAVDGMCPIGTIIAYGGNWNTAPSGWLPCDGSEISRATYARLWNRIFDYWGKGNGSTTFNLPDLRGMFLRGISGARTADPDKDSRVATNGGNGGNAVGSLQGDAFRAHNHTGRTVNNPDEPRPIQRASEALVGSYNWHGASPQQAHVAHTFDNVASHQHGIPTDGGNETRPINVYVTYLIKAN